MWHIILSYWPATVKLNLKPRPGLEWSETKRIHIDDDGVTNTGSPVTLFDWHTWSISWPFSSVPEPQVGKRKLPGHSMYEFTLWTISRNTLMTRTLEPQKHSLHSIARQFLNLTIMTLTGSPTWYPHTGTPHIVPNHTGTPTLVPHTIRTLLSYVELVIVVRGKLWKIDQRWCRSESEVVFSDGYHMLTTRGLRSIAFEVHSHAK